MKIGEYEQMMAYLTRPGFSGGSDKKPTTIKDLKDSGKIVTGDKYKPSNPKLIQAIRDFELRNPRKKNDQGGLQIPEPKPYTLEQFQERADLFIKGALGGFPKDEMINKLQIELDKVQESGNIDEQEALRFIKERTQQLREFIKDNPGETLPELDIRENFSKGGLAEYLSTLKPGSVINTYELGKKFKVAPATVRGQVERNFPELKLQTIEEGAAKAKETRRAQYAEKTSDVPIIQSEVKGKGAEARTKGRNIIGVKFPNEELENKYIKYMEDRYSDVKGRKGPSNKELATEFYGDASTANVAKIEKINQFYKKNFDLKFKKAPPDEVKEKRTRRLAITQGGKTFTGTDQIPFHHIMPIGGEVDLTTKDVAFINKQMNSKLAPYNTKLNDIADAISNQLNNQEPGYLNRVDELNKQAEQIVESAKTRLPKKFQNYIGFNRLDPILDEYGTPIRMNVTRVGVDDSKSLAGKKGEAVKLETLTQKKLLDKIKKSGKVGAAGVLAAAVPSTFALADDRLAGEQPVEGTGEGLPSEAALPAGVLLGKYGPQILNALKSVGKVGLKTVGSVPAAGAFAGTTIKENLEEGKNIVDATVDPLVGIELLLPETVKKLGPLMARAARVSTPVGAALTGVGLLKERALGMMRDADALTKTPYQEDLIDEYAAKQYRGYESGGRVGFADGPEDPSKRKFMKIMGGLASLPIVGRFFDVAQVAEKAAPAAVETIKNAPQHFIGLVNKIRALGKVVDPKNLMPDEQKRFSNVYDYGDYKMFESKDGQIEISKENLMATDYGDGIVSEEYMSYNPKTPKINKKGEIEGYEDEYNEYTAYADEDGKMKDVQDGIEESTKDDGIYSKEELEQLIVEQIENDLKKGKK